ncbi:lipocalin/fatty acid-binding family protein [Levilactobacillus mulengensis]|uniref:hypothetical protein n=1 Tax=Levilactobacillus mulengensis TaxID=2486025 RepID=UPI000F779B66|nr:hypothetical protein [Levilactobacillus mulengensis]
MASNDEQRSATTIFTTAAQSIAARLIANKTTAKFTKAEISTTNLFNQSVTELQVLTSLDNVQQTADINTVTVINDSTVDVNIAIDQTKAPNDYQMNSVGLFAVDGDGKEVLYSVTVLKDPVYIHQDAMGSALGIDLETVVGQSSNVDLSINPAGAVTNEELKVTLADYVKMDDVKSLIPATVIDGSKPADFKESVTLEKGAVDGAGNTIATTKDVSDGDAETLTSAKAYADAKISGKADDSTVVHTADMRKPASDVAGIEEVNAKQDKIGYTPADDSKVVHTADMRKPASAVAGIEEVNAKQDKLTITPADDSKVAHLSGANNFDTVPTVNNNPLLLASSLPSDLARLSQDANFTAKLQQNGQDVALANNTIARNPNTGVVSEPVDFTNLTVNGGKSVATSDDLKSLQLKMWHEIKLPDRFVGGPILMKYNPDDRTTMIVGNKKATLKDGASWTGALFTLPEGFHWIATDSKMMGLDNMDHYNDNVSGRLYNTKLSRNGSSYRGSAFDVCFSSMAIDGGAPYTTVRSIQPD